MLSMDTISEISVDNRTQEDQTTESQSILCRIDMGSMEFGSVSSRLGKMSQAYSSEKISGRSAFLEAVNNRDTELAKIERRFQNSLNVQMICGLLPQLIVSEAAGMELTQEQWFHVQRLIELAAANGEDLRNARPDVTPIATYLNSLYTAKRMQGGFLAGIRRLFMGKK